VLTKELQTHLWKLKNSLLWSVPRETELDNIKKYITGMLFVLIKINLHVYLKISSWVFIDLQREAVKQFRFRWIPSL